MLFTLALKAQTLNDPIYLNYSFFPSTSDEENQAFATRLHDLRYSAILRAKVSDRFELLSISRVLLRSDLQEGLQMNDMFPFALLLGNYAIRGNPNFTIGAGIALNSDFNHNAIIPIAILNYESEKIKLEIVYPNINFLYKKSPSLEFGLFANVDGSISRISQNNVVDEKVRFQRNFQVLVAPTVSFRIYKQIFGHFKAGVVPINNFQLLDKIGRAHV